MNTLLKERAQINVDWIADVEDFLRAQLDPGWQLDPSAQLDPGTQLDPGYQLDPGFQLDPGSQLNPNTQIDPYRIDWLAQIDAGN